MSGLKTPGLERVVRAACEAGGFLNAGLRAQAQWELEISRTILARRRWVLLLALLPVFLGFLIRPSWAVELPESLGGNRAFLPALVTPAMFGGSVLVGLLAGLITGVIGAGGGYILTPALMSFGVRGIMAVGTDQFHLFAKAIMGTTIHWKLGNVNPWLALTFVVGSILGASAGGWTNRRVYHLNPSLSDAMICAIYVVVLGLLAAYALADWLRRRKTAGDEGVTESTTAFARRMQRLRLWPYVRFDQDLVPGGRSLSVYPVVACGALVGFVAALMGVGGGFLTFPMFVYGLGVSTFTTVGTDIFQIIFTTAYSSISQYAVFGYIFYSVAMGMLLGSLVGVQIGALVTTVVKGTLIRAFFAVTILAGFVNRLAVLPKKLSESGFFALDRRLGDGLELVGTVLFFSLVGLFAGWVLWSFARNLREFRREEARR